MTRVILLGLLAAAMGLTSARAATLRVRMDMTAQPQAATGNVYYGTQSGVYTDRASAARDGMTANVLVSNLVASTRYYMAATASGLCAGTPCESAFSAEISVTPAEIAVPEPPAIVQVLQRWLRRLMRLLAGRWQAAEDEVWIQIEVE